MILSPPPPLSPPFCIVEIHYLIDIKSQVISAHSRGKNCGWIIDEWWFNFICCDDSSSGIVNHGGGCDKKMAVNATGLDRKWSWIGIQRQFQSNWNYLKRWSKDRAEKSRKNPAGIPPRIPFGAETIGGVSDGDVSWTMWWNWMELELLDKRRIG